jgi:ribosome maturation factor RimP
MSGNSRQGGGRADSRPARGRADAEQVTALARPVIGAAGLDLEAVRVTSAGRRTVLRVVVDGDGGVSLDDIALVSRELSAVLDASPVMGEQPWTLEVSSPGVDRPLTEPRHWRRAMGRLVTVPLMGGAGGAGSAGGAGRAGQSGSTGGATATLIEGRVTGASSDAVTLDTGGETRQFGYRELGPGRIQIEFARIGDADGPDGADEEGPDGH